MQVERCTVIHMCGLSPKACAVFLGGGRCPSQRGPSVGGHVVCGVSGPGRGWGLRPLGVLRPRCDVPRRKWGVCGNRTWLLLETKRLLQIPSQSVGLCREHTEEAGRSATSADGVCAARGPHVGDSCVVATGSLPGALRQPPGAGREQPLAASSAWEPRGSLLPQALPDGLSGGALTWCPLRPARQVTGPGGRPLRVRRSPSRVRETRAAAHLQGPHPHPSPPQPAGSGTDFVFSV